MDCCFQSLFNHYRFLRMLRLAEKELAKHFDICEFHDKMLGHGSIPLSMLAEKIEEYIARKKKDG